LDNSEKIKPVKQKKRNVLVHCVSKTPVTFSSNINKSDPNNNFQLQKIIKECYGVSYSISVTAKLIDQELII